MAVHKHQRNRHSHDGDHRWQGEDERAFRRPPLEMDEAPVLYKTYDGHVTGVRDFGIFVNLHGVKEKVTGLVHISRLAEKRNHQSDSIGRGQPVKVKVISIDGARIGLSMKDVDQDTVQDLRPRVDFGSGANMQPLGSGRNGHTIAGFQKPDPAIELLLQTCFSRY